MRTRRTVCLAAIVFLALASPNRASAQSTPQSLAATRVAAAELRTADLRIDQMVRARELRVRETMRDGLLPSRDHQRLDQYHHGVRVVGADVTRQMAADGTVSIFGTLHTDLTIPTDPSLTADAARGAIAQAAGGEYLGTAAPELVVLPLPDGYHLAYGGQAIGGLEVVNVFVDANSGALLQQYSEFQREGVIGRGVGTYGDSKKMSVKAAGAAFVADDGLRPAAITSYDMRGDLSRTTAVLNRVVNLTASDVASDTDNNWTDGAVVDAHVYAGWYYDFLFRRFGRHGFDDRDLRTALLVHPVRLTEIAAARASVVNLYYATPRAALLPQ